jgi:type IV fimbrial biogenesis protein FimT
MIRGHFVNRGVTLVELLTALAVAAILVTVAVPAFVGVMGNTVLRQEANRLVTDIQFARSEAIKRGRGVNICQADTESCDIGDPESTCECKTGVPVQRYDLGWLIHTARGANTDYDPEQGDILLRVGMRTREWVTIYGNEEVKHRIAIAASGAFDQSAADRGLLVLCTNQESIDEIPGRAIEVKLSGRPSIKKVKKGKGKGKKDDGKDGGKKGGKKGDDDDDGGGGKKGGKKGKKAPEDEECLALDGADSITGD